MTPKLFKESNNSKAEEIKKNLPVNLNLDFKTISPFIAQVEHNHLLPVLGKPLFDKLVNYYNSEPQENEYYNTLLDYVQFASIYIAYWEGFDIISVSLSDVGAGTKIEGDKRLYRYQEDNIKEALKNHGFNQIDIIIEYLTDHIAKFPDFELSEYWSKLTNSLVPDTATFNRYYNINSSRLLFQKMKYFITQVEEIDICERIGRNMFDDMIEHRDLPKYKAIERYLQGYVVFKSVAAGIVEMGKIPTERGLVVKKNTTTGNIAGQIEQPVGTAALEKTAKLYSEKAESYMASAIHYIKNHKQDYPLFFAFTGEDVSEDRVIRRDNTNKKTFWA